MQPQPSQWQAPIYPTSSQPVPSNSHSWTSFLITFAGMDPIFKWLTINCSSLEIYLPIPIALRQEKHSKWFPSQIAILWRVKVCAHHLKKITTQCAQEGFITLAAQTKLFYLGEWNFVGWIYRYTAVQRRRPHALAHQGGHNNHLKTSLVCWR
jgi:hypothetical protein